jgi:hypothetical protein
MRTPPATSVNLINQQNVTSLSPLTETNLLSNEHPTNQSQNEFENVTSVSQDDGNDSTSSTNSEETNEATTTPDTTQEQQTRIKSVYSCNVRGCNSAARTHEILELIPFRHDTILLWNETNTAPIRIKKIAARFGFNTFATWDPTRRIGSGCSILIPKRFSGYARNIKKHGGYGIALTLFLNQPVVFVSIYLSHESQRREGLLQWILELYQQARERNFLFCIGGDFNSIANLSDASSNHTHCLHIDRWQLHSSLTYAGLMDIHATCSANPEHYSIQKHIELVFVRKLAIIG